MCEILATHFRLPSDLGGTPPFLESWQETEFWPLLIPDSFGTDTWHRIKQYGAPVQDWGTREYATNMENIHIKGNRVAKSAMRTDHALGQQSQAWHLIYPAAWPWVCSSIHRVAQLCFRPPFPSFWSILWIVRYPSNKYPTWCHLWLAVWPWPSHQTILINELGK